MALTDAYLSEKFWGFADKAPARYRVGRIIERRGLLPPETVVRCGVAGFEHDIDKRKVKTGRLP
jgi:hypothetical protein